MMKNVSIRLRSDLVREASRLARLESVDKSVIIREAIEKGVEELRLMIAVEMFSKGRASTSEAAEIAGISVGEMMELLTKRGLRPDITAEDIKGSLDRALKAVN